MTLSRSHLRSCKGHVSAVLSSPRICSWWKVRIKQSPSSGASPADAPTGLVPATYVMPLEPIKHVVAMYDYTAAADEELSINENGHYELYEDDGEWVLLSATGKSEVGFAPSSYVEVGRHDVWEAASC